MYKRQGLAVVSPAWMRASARQRPEKFVQFGERIFGLKRDARSEKEAGRAMIDALKGKYRSWGLPVSLKDIGVGEKDFEKIAQEVTTDPDSGVKDKKIVFDVLGSGAGERVLIAQGSVAASWFPGKPPPVDALIIGSIDPPAAPEDRARRAATRKTSGKGEQ